MPTIADIAFIVKPPYTGKKIFLVNDFTERKTIGPGKPP